MHLREVVFLRLFGGSVNQNRAFLKHANNLNELWEFRGFLKGFCGILPRS